MSRKLPPAPNYGTAGTSSSYSETESFAETPDKAKR